MRRYTLFVEFRKNCYNKNLAVLRKRNIFFLLDSSAAIDSRIRAPVDRVSSYPDDD
jgi:hypothetical protein